MLLLAGLLDFVIAVACPAGQLAYFVMLAPAAAAAPYQASVPQGKADKALVVLVPALAELVGFVCLVPAAAAAAVAAQDQVANPVLLAAVLLAEVDWQV